MPSCSAYKCKARHSQKIPGVSFHKFPKDKKRRQTWIYAMHKINWQPTNNSCLCSSHFREDDFEPDSPFKKQLKKDVVPSIFPQLPAHLQPKLPRERRIIVKHSLIKNKKKGKEESSESLEKEVTTIDASPNRKETEVTFIDMSHVFEAVEENKIDQLQLHPAPISENTTKQKHYTSAKIVFNQTERVCPLVTELVKELKVIKKKIDAKLKRIGTKNHRMKASIQKLKKSLAELKDDTARGNTILLSLFENALVEPETEPKDDCIEEVIEDVPVVEQAFKETSKEKCMDFGMFLANELRQIPTNDLNSLKNEIRLLVNKNRWGY